jgi:uncharacterized repeat protein (TIGR02543 family)
MTQNAGDSGNLWSIDTTLPAGSHTFRVRGDIGELNLGGVISGAGGLTVRCDHDGFVTLSAENTYSGDTTIYQYSYLSLGIDNAIPHGPGKGVVNVGGEGTLDLFYHSAVVNGLSGDGWVGTDGDPEGDTNTLTVGDGDATRDFAGYIEDGGAILSLVKIGTGTQVLSGSNSYTGGTTINNGGLDIDGAEALPAGGDVAINLSDAGVPDSSALNVHSNAAIGRLTGDGMVYGEGDVTLDVGVGDVDGGFSGGITDGGEDSGFLSLRKVGSGMLILTGTNTYIGPTIVNDGELLLDSSGSTSADSVVTVQPAAVLSGSGSAAGAVSVEGTVSPGYGMSAIRTLHTGSETWASGGSYAFQIQATADVPGTDWDLLDITGDLAVAASAGDPFTIRLASVGDLTDFDPSKSYEWEIATLTGESTGFDSSKFVVNTDDFAPVLAGGTFSVAQDDGHGDWAVYLVFTPGTSHTVHFDSDGTAGSSVSSMTQTVAQGGAALPVAAVAPAGYHFVNWTGTGSFETTTANPVTVSNVTAEMTITANFAPTLLPPPYSVTWSPVRGGTLIQWAGSPGATGYQVWLGTVPAEPTALFRAGPGRLLGTTGPSTCSLFVPEYFGPNSIIYVVALGTPVGSLPGMGVYTASVTPVQLGTVRFNGNSSKLTPATKRALRSYASLMATQGFTSLKVSGYTAKFDHGSKAFRRRLSVKRAKNVKAYLATEFRRLHAHVSITTAGYGGTNPVASNKSAWGMARNRRAELILK